MMNPRRARILVVSVAVAASFVLAGCGKRIVRESLVAQRHFEIDTVRQKDGFAIESLGHEHPAIISTERLTHILGALEIEKRSKKGGIVRQPAIHPELVARTAEGLSTALREIDPDQELAIKVVRKESNLGVFHRKFLTTFIAYVHDDHLYILLRRVDWPIPQAKESERLSNPTRRDRPMSFRIVTADPIYSVGRQEVEIAWRDAAFAKPFRLPGSTSGETRRREVLLQAPIPKAERDASEKAMESEGVSLGDLTPDELRALADLEDDRREGRITEAAYQRARRQMLRKR